MATVHRRRARIARRQTSHDTWARDKVARTLGASVVASREVSGEDRPPRAAREPVAEQPPPRAVPEASGWGWLPAIGVVAGVALVLIALADSGARFGRGWAQPLFWAGLVVLFLPAAVRLLSREAGPGERMGLLVVVGMGLYLVKVLHEPTSFTLHDELGQWRSTADIVSTGHLFRPNAIVGAYPYYPGLAIVTAALVKLTGLSIFQAGTVVTGVARLILPFALYWLFEQVTGSPRLAGIAVLLYMTNPTFIFFDSQFAYESFAVPLAVLAVVLAITHASSRRKRGALAVFIVVLIAGLIASHHVTSYALCLLLLVWSAITAWMMRRNRSGETARTVWVAAAALLGTALWLVFVALSPTQSELAPVARGLWSGLAQLVTGGGAGKQVFTASTGQAEAPLAQAAGYASVALILVALPFGLWVARRRAARSPAVAALALAAVLYPGTLAIDVFGAGSETSNRSSGFVFFGVALVLAILVADRLLVRGARPPPGSPRLRRVLPRVALPGVAVAITVLLVGGLIVGWPPYDRLPGPYLTAADQRSVQPQGVDAARWAGSYLGTGNRMAADDTNGLLMAAYGAQEPQFGAVGRQSVADLFFSAAFGDGDRRIIAGDQISFIVVDDRLSKALPLRGFYIEGDEPGAYQHRKPIAAGALTKFDNAPGLARIFDSGNIAIYDSRGLTGGGTP